MLDRTSTPLICAAIATFWSCTLISVFRIGCLKFEATRGANEVSLCLHEFTIFTFGAQTLSSCTAPALSLSVGLQH